jgi:hypothetical protein
MKVYKTRYNKIFFAELSFCEEGLLECYNNLFDELLLSRNISNKKIFQLFNINRGTITSTPFVIKDTLRQKELPAFRFLVCKN